MLWIIFFFMVHVPGIFPAVTLVRQPLCRVYTQNSILEKKESYKPNFIGNRKRWATCTGAAWLDDHLFVVNLYGQKISVYRFYAQEKRFELIQEITNADGAQLTKSENLVFSPDGSLLAVCSGLPCAGIKIYSVDRQKYAINPKPIFDVKSTSLVHNIRFTPDGAYLAATTWDNNSSVCLYQICKDAGSIDLKCVYQKENRYKDLVTKGINFTRDGKFAVVAYSIHAGKYKKDNVKGLVAIHTFNSATGMLGDEVSRFEGMFCSEDVVFLDNDRMIMCSDQNSDSLVLYSFNPENGQIGRDPTIIQGFETLLNFPHGMALKHDGNYLVITNYGDDSFNLYRVQNR